MANRLLCGWDEYDATGLAFEWNVNGSPTIVAGRTSNAVRCPASGDFIAKSITPEGQVTWTFGIAIKPETTPGVPTAGFLAVGDATKTHLTLARNADGTISCYRSGALGAVNTTLSGATLLSTTTGTAPLDQWTQIEVSITIGDGTSGAVAIRFNGSSVDDPTGSVSGVDTRNAGTALLTWLCLACQVSGIGSADSLTFDDLYVNDATGSDCAGFLGDIRVDFHMGAADGATSDWTPSTGATQYGVVDEHPQNVADYLSTLTLNAVTTMSVEAFKNDGADILALQPTFLAKKSDAGTCAIAPVIRESGVDAPGTGQYPTTDWGYLRENYSIGVGNAKRAAAGFNAAEYGVKKAA